ncbi:MAG: ribonuclease D [Desulfobacterales bacterium]|nr:ribonuclease D [Desulfobacterales bacterium]MCP4158478.1 ribonuclease D [Deltaproteobacteria bacterium]
MSVKISQNYKYINSTNELIDVSENLDQYSAIAVDLEADSMFHFKEKVCLIQIATEDYTIVIDPLTIGDLSSLKPIFENKNIKKIFHGSDYDIRSLHRDFDFEINNLFDTELACRFLGEKHTGLSTILEKRYDIKLDKRYQKKDWSQRPLPQGMVDYGAKDVFFLISLASELEKELENKGRISWISEECEILSKVRANMNNKEHLFMKVKGAGRLNSRSLGILESLCALRIRYAKQKDKPLFKIMSNESLLKLSVKKPVTKDHLKKLKILSPKQISMFGNDIVSVIHDAMDISSKDLPVYPRKKPPALKPEVPLRIKNLKKWRDKKAMNLSLDPSLIINKALINSLAIQNPKSVDALDKLVQMRFWQKNEFGDEIVKSLKI